MSAGQRDALQPTELQSTPAASSLHQTHLDNPAESARPNSSIRSPDQIGGDAGGGEQCVGARQTNRKPHASDHAAKSQESQCAGRLRPAFRKPRPSLPRIDVMREPVSSEPFHALASALKEGGFAEHGLRIEGILNGTWTTSSELIAELGQAVLIVRKECAPLSPALRALLKECLRQVRKAWPGFGWFSWLPRVRRRP